MANNDYVTLADVNGNDIYPITDLAAINMTTADGIQVAQTNGGTIGIQSGYIESRYWTNMTSPGVGAATIGETYLQGGTMFQLIGGYTVTDEIPPITSASHEKIPSEYSVRSAIDALATLGPSLAPGAGIVVETIPGSSGGTIAVAPGNGINVNTAQTGGVSVNAATSGGLSVTSDGVAVNAGNGLAIDSSNNINAVAKTSGGLAVDGGGIGIVAGDTLDLTGGTVNAKVADVDEVLTSKITGSTVQDAVEEVTPANLRGALSVGQAVDVSCCPVVLTYDEISLDQGGTWLSGTAAKTALAANNAFMGEVWCRTVNPKQKTSYSIGFSSSTGNQFPKRAPGLKYLAIADVRNSGIAVRSIDITQSGFQSVNRPVFENSTSFPVTEGNTQWTRVATWFPGEDAQAYVLARIMTTGADASATITGTAQLDIKNFRVYEVTALTDDAIAYLAKLPDPDQFFRSASTGSVLNKYLVKQDMVCPWIKTISMDDNKDLTVAAGLSYKIKYTNDNAHKITVDTIPTDAYGWDAHIQMFVKGTASVQFQPPLVLMNALTPNAGHNLSVKFRNGQALVYVDDLNAGYIVVSPTGSTATEGSLAYGLAMTPANVTDDKYIVFGSTVNGLVCDFGTVTPVYGATATAINLIGNGTDQTFISGTLTVPSDKTVNMQDLAVTGSTLSGTGTINLSKAILNDSDIANTATYLNDVEIPAGSTVNTVVNGSTGSFYPIDVTLNGVLNTTLGTDDSARNGIRIKGTGLLKGDSNSRQGKFWANTIAFDGITIDGIIGTHSGDGGAFVLRGDSYGNGVATITGCTVQNCKAVNTSGTVVGGGAFLTSKPNVATGYTATIYVNNSIITDNGLYDMAMYYDGTMHIQNSNVRAVMYYNDKSGLKETIIIEGISSLKQITRGGGLYTCHLRFASGCTFDMSVYGTFTNGTNNPIVFEDNVSFITASGTTAYIDGCEANALSKDGEISGDITIVGSAVDPWKAANVIFTSPLDAHEASTVQLSGTTFTSASLISAPPARIQLVVGTTVSFSGNTNAENTKILQAPVMVVGNNAAAPSGSATLVNAAGATSSISGIGTWIDKEGDNDFVSLESINTVTVATGDSATAESLASAFAQTTGVDGENRWIKLQDNISAVVVAPSDATVPVVDKNIITNEYEPVFGGTFTVSAGGTLTIDENNKKTTMGGATLSLVDAVVPKGATVAVSGGGLTIEKVTGSGTIDLGHTNIAQGSGANFSATDCIITGGSATNGGVFGLDRSILTFRGLTLSGNSASSNGGVANSFKGDTTFTDCNFVDNHADGFGGAVAGNSATYHFSSCTFSGNSASYGGATHCPLNAIHEYVSCVVSGNEGTYPFMYMQGGTASVSQCIIDGDIGAYHTETSATLDFAGSNAFRGAITGRLYVNISSGAILDMTSNTDPTPIAPNGGITFEAGGATVYPSAGSASSILVGGVSKVGSISSDGALTAVTGSAFVLGTSAVASNAVFNNGANVAFTQTPSVGSFTDCTIGQVAQGNSNVTWVVTYSGTMKFGSYQSNLGGASRTIIITNGTILDFTDISNNNHAYVEADNIQVQGTITWKDKTGTPHSVIEGNYTSFNADGTTTPPQPA